jgi:GT2 family glycosyltransferase/tetratricopeptide (TPR) repeat protein
VDQIGYLDERFGIGTMEDDDYCLRAHRAGFRAVIARDTFVHHFGHQTFKGASIDFDALQQKNLELFRTKWERQDGLPSGTLDFGRTSIVIVTHNQIEFTRQCVESVRRYTNEPYELIFVDNASSDGTVEYLRQVSNSKLITNPVNLGFPAAVNQGIQAASGQQVLLLNNDCVVPRNWLRPMLRALYRDASIGLAGPTSNCVSGEQEVKVDYKNADGLNRFAAQWARIHANEIVDTDRLVGFCLLIKRTVLDTIGLFDEQFGVGCFEDDDYCVRALQAGHRAVIARDAFVHHYGGRTFLGTGVDLGALMKHNEELFRSKWNTAKEPSQEVCPNGGRKRATSGALGLTIGPQGGLLLTEKRICLSLCMIVRDNARTIEACLKSIKPWVDEMIVVDTGSKDATPEIATKLGARLFHFPWCDSFSAARNESLRYARGDWIFWMDSDDTITQECGRNLRELADSKHDPTALGYVMQVHCTGPDEDDDVTIVDHVKLFRNRVDLRFEGRIHEQIIPSIRRAGGTIPWTDIYVVHSGYDHSAEGQERKKRRDLHLLNLELRDQPNHPFTLFNLGMTYNDLGQHEAAIGFLQQSLANSNAGESYVRKVYALLVRSFQALGKMDQAWETCNQGLECFPKDAESLFRKAALLHEKKRFAEAEATYLFLLGSREERHYVSLVHGIRGHLARQNLAVLYTDMGELAKAEQQWRFATQDTPLYRAGWRGLGDCLLKQKKRKDAAAVAQNLTMNPKLRAEGLMLQGQLAIETGDIDGARRDFERALREFPDDTDVAHVWCRFLFEHIDMNKAEEPLSNLLKKEPKDASALHNLGTIYLRSGRPGKAIDAFRKSLDHRPDSAMTYLTLGYAYQTDGDLALAKQAWQKVLTLAPDGVEAAEAESCLQGC